jgi:hypothetical protein
VPVARPAVVRQVGHHAGAHRIEFDGAHARQEIGLCLHDTGLAAPFPEAAAALVSAIDAALNEVQRVVSKKNAPAMWRVSCSECQMSPTPLVLQFSQRKRPDSNNHGWQTCPAELSNLRIPRLPNTYNVCIMAL